MLGIYGRQSLDFANMWNVPKPTDPVAYSFHVYRDFDGAGGQFGNTSVNSTSTDQGQLSVYGAVRSSDGALTIIAINKTTGAIQTTLTLANFNSNTTAAVYTYSIANLTQIVAGAPVPVASNTVDYNFPAYSATVFAFTPAPVSPVGTTTTLSASSMQITSGESVTFTAAVAPKSGTSEPGGAVAFSNGTTQIGTGTLNSSGVATFHTSGLAVGTYSITAAYSGDAGFSESTSAAVTITVSATTKVATTTSESAPSTQLTSGQAVTFTATVAPKSGSAAPTGVVTFTDGATQVGAGTLNSSGTTTFVDAALSVGSHSISAIYSGDANFSTSTSAAVSVTVSAPAKIATATSISVSATQLSAGRSVTFTAGVVARSGNGAPTGSIAFFDAQTQIGMSAVSGGMASMSSANLAAGTHAILATYSGDTNYAASSSSVASVVVSAVPTPDYSLSLSNAALSIAPGASGSVTVTVVANNGFKQALGLSCSGLPAGGTCTFSPQRVNPAGKAATSSLSIQAPAATGVIGSSSSGLVFSSGRAPLYGFVMTLVGILAVVANRRSLFGSRDGMQFVPAVLPSLMFAIMLMTAGCAAYTAKSATQEASYEVTVTASAAGAPTHTQQFTLTVTP